MHKNLCISDIFCIFASEKETNNKLNPKTRKGREIMKTLDFIETMKAQVEILKAERLDVKKLAAKDDNAYHRFNKLGHEISAIENAIREMEIA